MREYTQKDRWLKVKTPLPDDALLLEAFRGREALSELFEFSLELLALNETKIPFDHILGKPITVEMEQEEGPPRFFDGIVRELRRGRSGSIFTNYRATVVPAVWKLSRRIQSRIFQNQTAIEILRTVFDGYDVDFKIRQRHFPHNYCVQYDESDFAFASRLMEEEGIYYYFVHAVDGESRQPKHKLVIADESSLAPPAPGEPVRFDSVGGGVRPKACIHDWEVVQQLCTRRHELRGRHFESFTNRLAAQSATLASVAVGGSELRLHVSDDDMTAAGVASGVIHRFDALNSNGGNQQDRFSELYPALEQEAKLRAEEASADAVRIEGAGACSHLEPGMRFVLAGRRFDDGDYLMTAIEHEAAAPPYRSSDDNAPAEKYSNRFTAIPAALPFRPKRRTSAPRIDGVQSAIVVGPAGQEIYTDAYGRIKVCFQWDQQQKCDGSDTCWVRVASQWAGQGYGMISLPRIGQEVVVAFEDGDPDAPLVVGSVYNNDQTTPFSLPADLTKMCIKSKTVGGDSDQFHGLLFDDKKSNELLHIRSQKDAIVDCKHDYGTYVPNQKTTRVGNCRLHVTGGLPLGIGSGSGGSAEIASTESKVAFSVSISNAKGSGAGGEDGKWEAASTLPDAFVPLNLSATCGLQAQSILGANIQTTFPLNASYQFDPIGALSICGSQGGSWQNITRAISGVATGDVEIAYGATFNATYGASFSFERGADGFQNEGALSSRETWALSILAGVNVASILTSTLAPVIAGFFSDETAKLYSSISAAATQLTGAIVMKYEQFNAKAQDAASRSLFAEEALATYKGVVTNKQSLEAYQKELDEYDAAVQAGANGTAGQQALVAAGRPKPPNLVDDKVPDSLKAPILTIAKSEAKSALENGDSEGKYKKHTVAGRYELTAEGISIVSTLAAGELTIQGNNNDLTIKNAAPKVLSVHNEGNSSITMNQAIKGEELFVQAYDGRAILLEVGSQTERAKVAKIQISHEETSNTSKIVLQTSLEGQSTKGASITLDGPNVTIAAGENGTVTIKSNGDNGGKLTLSNDLAELAAGVNADKLSINNSSGGLTFTSTTEITATAATNVNITTSGGKATFTCTDGTDFV